MYKPDKVSILKKIIALLIIISAFSKHCAGQTDSAAHQMLVDIQKSHINANVPGKSEFETILKRDLEKFFLSKYGKITVKYEFLREGATQSGTSYPKYYLWTKIYKKDLLLNEGATRVEVIDKDHFNITDFVPIVKIKKEKIDIYQVFPAAVCEKIKEYL